MSQTPTSTGHGSAAVLVGLTSVVDQVIAPFAAYIAAAQ
jgi:hypothetical protein